MILRHYLLMYDRATGELVVAHEYEDAVAAARAYAALEQRYRNEPGIEIVLVGSDSLDTIKLTHANYFGDDVEMPFRELVS